MITLGITLGPQGAVALKKDGKILAAVEESRYQQVNKPWGIPFKAIDFCRQVALNEGLVIETVLYHLPRWMISEEASQSILSNQVVSELRQYFGQSVPILEIADPIRSIPKWLGKHSFPITVLVHIDVERESAGFIVGERYEEQIFSDYPHTLGALYEATAKYLGLGTDIGRLEDLATLGEPTYLSGLRKIFLEPEALSSSFDTDWIEWHHNPAETFSGMFQKRFGPIREDWEPYEARHAHIAASVQALIEERVLAMARWLHKQASIGGMCLLGSVVSGTLVGRMLEDGPFTDVVVPPAPGPEGTVLRLNVPSQPGEKALKAISTLRLGPTFSAEDIRLLLNSRRIGFKSPKEMPVGVVERLKQGGVVGWLSGCAELGRIPCGGRVILVDPTSPESVERLRRLLDYEEFRSVAVLVDRREVSRFFEVRNSPAMPCRIPVKDEAAESLIGVIQEDGYAWVVPLESQKDTLLESLFTTLKESGSAPMVAALPFESTSIGRITTPEDALVLWDTGLLEALVLEGYLIER